MAYPKKMLSPDGATVLAKQAIHEAELLAEGYEPAPVEAQEPTPCAKCAELQAEVDRLTAAQKPTTDATAPAKRGRPAKA